MHNGTKEEIQRCLDGGMEQLSKEELEQELFDLGYKIDPTLMSFDYFNSGNETKYEARSIHISNKETGRSFCNIDEKRDPDFDKLQKLRSNCFVVHRGRFWEF